MFTLNNTGRPIAKSKARSPIILSIIDDTETTKRNKSSSDSESYTGETSDSSYESYENSSSSEDNSSSEEKPIYKEKLPKGKTIYKSKEELTPIPDLTSRFVEYIAGPSGAGKSTKAAELAQEFKHVFPKRPIYIFSRTDAQSDPAFSKLKPIQIAIDESLIEEPIDITQEITEEGSLLIFDDCTTIHNDKIRKEIEKLMADAMEVGRKLNCNIIITNHLVIPNDKKIARTIMNELTVLTVFPKSGASQQISYTLKQYFGLNKKQIDEIVSLKSRWVRISRTYPQYVLYDHGAYIL